MKNIMVNERLVTYIDSLSWQLPPYLENVEKEAREQEVPIIRRSMQSLLAFLLELVSPSKVLEVGAAVGFSSMLMSEHVSEQSTITTIEKVPVRIVAARENYAKHNKTDRIELLEGDAADVLKELVKQGKTYDFIFMDAAKGQYLNYLPDIISLLEPGGMLVTDNVLQDGDIIESRYAVTKRDRTIHGRMREYLYRLTHDELFDTVILPVGDGVALSKKK